MSDYMVEDTKQCLIIAIAGVLVLCTGTVCACIYGLHELDLKKQPEPTPAEAKP